MSALDLFHKMLWATVVVLLSAGVLASFLPGRWRQNRRRLLLGGVLALFTVMLSETLADPEGAKQAFRDGMEAGEKSFPSPRQ